MEEKIIANEIINEVEVIDLANEEIVEAGSNFGWKLGVGVVALTAAAVVGYKLYKKLKAKKEQANEIEVEYNEIEEDRYSDCEE